MKKQILISLLSITSLVFTAVAQVNYQWVKGVGSQGAVNKDVAYSVAVDNNGAVYITGSAKSSEPPADFNIYNTPAKPLEPFSGEQCYLAKYDSIGNCVWVKNMTNVTQPGTSGQSYGKSIAVDGLGNVYVGGFFDGKIDFDPSPASNDTAIYTSTNNATLEGDAFLAKYDDSGNFQWLIQIGGSGFFDAISAITINEQNSLVSCSGVFNSDSLFFMPNQNQPDTLTRKGTVDAFLATFETSTGAIVWTSQIAAFGATKVLISAIDAGSSYLAVTGSFTGDSVVFYESNSNTSNIPVHHSTTGAGSNAFYGKYILTNGSVGWMNPISLGTAISTGVVLKNDSELFLTGVFNGTINIVDAFTTYTYTSIGNSDVYLLKSDIAGTIQSNKHIASKLNNTIYSSSIAVDEYDNIYISGYFSGVADFSPQGSSSPYTDTSSSFSDFYFAKYDNNADFVWERKIGGIEQDTIVTMALDSYNNIYLAGAYKDTIDFNLGTGVARRGSNGDYDIFLAKYSQGTAKIQGTVYLSNNTALDGTQGTGNVVRLYTQIQFDGNQAMNLIAETPINNVGYYEFNDVPEGKYLAFAFVGSYYSNSIVNTYHRVSGPNQDSAVFWEGATPIIPLSTSPASIADINMAVITPVFGNAKLSGKIIFGSGFDRQNGNVGASIKVGPPPPGNAIYATTETDTSGNYSFENLPADQCYRLYVDIVGLPMISNYSPCPGEYDSVPNLNFYVDSANIDTMPSIVSSVSQIISAEKTSVTLYPNPSTGIATIELTLTQPQNVSIEVYNLFGGKEMLIVDEKQQEGTIKYKYNAAENGIKPGIFIVKIKIGDKVITKKMIITR